MDTVTITREEHERLIEAAQDLEDLRAVTDAKANPEEGLPHEFMARIVAGDHPLAVHRDRRGLSQSALARLSGVNRIQIINIESGKSTGSPNTLLKLADALDILVDDIIRWL